MVPPHAPHDRTTTTPPNRPLLRFTVPITLNCMVGAATLAAAQEGVRAVRGGVSDPWGTLAAGSLSGALLVALRCESKGTGPRGQGGMCTASVVRASLWPLLV